MILSEKREITMVMIKKTLMFSGTIMVKTLMIRIEMIIQYKVLRGSQSCGCPSPQKSPAEPMMWRLCAGVSSLLIDRWVVGREQVRHGCKLVLSWHGEVGGGSLVRGLGPACVSDGSNTGEVSPGLSTRGGGHNPSLSQVFWELVRDRYGRWGWHGDGWWRGSCWGDMTSGRSAGQGRWRWWVSHCRWWRRCSRGARCWR